MRARKLLGFITACAFFLAGCATLINGEWQDVAVTSNPPDAKVSVDGVQLRTPGVLRLRRAESYTAKFEKEGYHPRAVEIKRHPSWVNWLDATWFYLFFIPLLADLGNGSFYTFDDVHADLVPRKDLPLFKSP